MEFVLNKIMSIDRDAEKYRKGIDLLLQEKQKDMENKINELKRNWQEEAKTLRENIYKAKLQEAEVRAEEISAEKKVLLNSIKNKYENSKEEIVNEVFSKIISSF